MKPFAASFVDFKNIKTREVVQLIFEVPAEEAMAALQYLGGNPIAGKEKWVAIARMAGPVDKLLGEDDGDRSEGNCAATPGESRA